MAKRDSWVLSPMGPKSITFSYLMDFTIVRLIKRRREIERGIFFFKRKEVTNLVFAFSLQVRVNTHSFFSFIM